MTTRPRPAPRAATTTAAAMAAMAAALAAGCGVANPSRPVPTTPTPGAASEIPVTGTPAPPKRRPPGGGPTEPGRVDERDATAVSEAALTVMHAVDSTVDAGLRDAKLRAKRYFTPEYASKVEAEPVQYVPAEWRRHRAYVAVRLRRLRPEAGAPSDGPTRAFRQWEVTTTPRGRDDWRGAPRTSVIYMMLVRSAESAPWRISGVLVPDGG